MSAQTENLATIIVCGAVVLGLYALGAGGYAMFGFLILGNINTGPAR